MPKPITGDELRDLWKTWPGDKWANIFELLPKSPNVSAVAAWLKRALAVMLYLPDQLDALRSNLAAAEADLAEVSADLREMTAQRDKLREAAEDVLDEHDRKQTRPLYS